MKNNNTLHYCSFCKRIKNEDELDLVDGKWVCASCELLNGEGVVNDN
jgi:hypothetical protein